MWWKIKYKKEIKETQEEINQIKIVINNNFNKIDKIYQQYKHFHDTLEKTEKYVGGVVLAPLGFDKLETPKKYNERIKETKTKKEEIFNTNAQDSLNNLNVKVYNMKQKLIVDFKEISKIAELLHTTLSKAKNSWVGMLQGLMISAAEGLDDWLTDPNIDKPK